jgi:hypothetical protein
MGGGGQEGATTASLASTPFKRFLVTTGNALALEGKFLQRGLQNPGGSSIRSAVCSWHVVS